MSEIECQFFGKIKINTIVTIFKAAFITATCSGITLLYPAGNRRWYFIFTWTFTTLYWMALISVPQLKFARLLCCNL